MYNLKLHDPYFLPHIGCDIELSLDKVMTLVGENGLGKTTLVERLHSGYSGRISIIEQRPLDAFYNRTLGRIKETFLSSRPGSIDTSLFLRAWEEFGLGKKEDRVLSSLSGGEGQALKICLGSAPVAEIYIMDEPSQYLDESMKKVLSDLILELFLRKKSVLMVEHDLKWQNFSMNVIQLKLDQHTLVKGSQWTT